MELDHFLLFCDLCCNWLGQSFADIICLFCASVFVGMKVKGKTTSSLSKTIIKTKTVKAKAEKKVYTLPGQKFDPPEEVPNIYSTFVRCFGRTFWLADQIYLLLLWQREPLRIFYESLSKQIPSSEMAEFWWVFFCSRLGSVPVILWFMHPCWSCCFWF